jgi:hypothetical protein
MGTEKFSGILPVVNLHNAWRAGLVSLGILAAPFAFAKPSEFCPTLSANVPKGGTVAINVSACDGPFNIGMGGPFPGFLPKSGKVKLGPQTKQGSQMVTYVHNGNDATKDVFYLEDNDNGLVTVNITISKSKARKK